MTTTNSNRTVAGEPPVTLGPIAPSAVASASVTGSKSSASAPASTSNATGAGDSTRMLPIEQRSELLGKSLARTTRFSEDFYRFVGNPYKHYISTSTSSPAAQLMLELIQPPKQSETNVSPNERFAASLAQSLRWFFQQTSRWMEPTREACFAKLLMPLYLHAASHGSAHASDAYASNQVTIGLLREMCAMIEMDRALSHHGFTEWLLQSQRRDRDPRITIAESFQVTIPGVATSLIQFALRRQGVDVDSGISIGSTDPSFENKQRGWWSLATQWCRRQTALTLPPGIAIGVVSWEKLRDHWSQLYRALDVDEAVPATKPVGSKSLSAVDVGNIAKHPSSNAPQTEESSDAVVDTHNKKLLESLKSSTIPSRVIEVRASNDPLLGNNLDQLLQSCRADQGTLSLVVLRHVAPSVADESNSYGLIRVWQSQFIDCMDSVLESNNVRGFVTESGELALVFEEADRNELAQSVRDSFAALNQAMIESHSLAKNRPVPLIAGIAVVCAPSRSFRIDQLIDAAWRCLEGAAVQGAGAVKSIEVY